MLEKTKYATIGDRKFVVKKYDARTGSYIAFKVAGLLAPAFEGILNMKDLEGGINLTKILAPALSALSSLPEADFMDIQTKSLRVCYEALPAGETRVLNDDGTFGAVGLEDDAATVMALTVHALIFNLTGFFQGGLLAGLGIGLATSSPPAASM